MVNKIAQKGACFENNPNEKFTFFKVWKYITPSIESNIITLLYSLVINIIVLPF